MKISYRTHPILERLQNGKLGKVDMSILDKDFFLGIRWRDFYNLWKEETKYFLSELNVISDPFLKASQKAGPKLIDLYYDSLNSKKVDLNFRGTFIILGGFAYLLRHEYKAEMDHLYISLFWFDRNPSSGRAILLGCFNSNRYGERLYIDSNDDWWMSKDYKRSFNINTPEEEIKELGEILGRCIALKMFKSYADVETKELKPNSKTRGINCKYVNDTDLKITYLDSKWFTTLVKSDAFNVRGHFRLQPFGEGLKEHKLIWISEFTKSGYTAPARKLSLTNSQLL